MQNVMGYNESVWVVGDDSGHEKGGERCDNGHHHCKRSGGGKRGSHGGAEVKGRISI